MSDHNSQFLRKAGFADLESALAAIESMSDEIRNLHNQMEHLERQYGFAMAERDEARRTLCNEYHLARNGRMSVEEIAKEMGWDCYDFRTNT